MMRVLAVTVFCLVGIYGGVQSIYIGISDFEADEARSLVNARLTANQAIDVGTLKQARMLFEAALTWNHENSTAHENLALVHYWRASRSELSYPERREALDEGMEHILIAMSMRPTSGYTYSNVALFKLLRGEQDVVFREALILAMKYGPYEPGVIANVTDIGLRAWNGLGEPERNSVRLAITNTLKSHPATLTTYLKAKPWLLPNCAELNVKIPTLCP